jgi:hypothetical protein
MHAEIIIPSRAGKLPLGVMEFQILLLVSQIYYLSGIFSSTFFQGKLFGIGSDAKASE